MIETIKYFIVKRIYADHNSSSTVKNALRDLLAQFPPGSIGLNIGAGKTRLHPQIRNMELQAASGIDYVGSVESIPVNDATFDVVITQEVLEHVASPDRAMLEIHRVLKPGGTAYVQLPFIIGFHPCPNDYWRFTHQGIVELATKNGFDVVLVQQSVGSAVGFYRVGVEYFSILFSVVIPPLYRPLKLLFSIVLYPIKWTDIILRYSREANRIAGGFFVVCRKR